MAKEILAIPEPFIGDVIKVIRAGLEAVLSRSNDVDEEVREQLNKWCDDMEAHHFGVPDEDDD